jgi:hypothetical protein
MFSMSDSLAYFESLSVTRKVFLTFLHLNTIDGHFNDGRTFLDDADVDDRVCHAC